MNNAAFLLRGSGLRVTADGLSILETLARAQRPATAAELLAKLSRGSDRVTVYRALERFVAKGLVRPIRIGTVCRYEIRDEHDHHHVVCTDCGRIQDISACAMEALRETVAKQATEFARISDHSFEVFGVCRPCAKKKKTRGATTPGSARPPSFAGPRARG